MANICDICLKTVHLPFFSTALYVIQQIITYGCLCQLLKWAKGKKQSHHTAVGNTDRRLSNRSFRHGAAAPPLLRPGNPALCGSHPLVTPYYCRLGDLLCFVFMTAYCMFDLYVYYLFLQYFDTVGWVF